MAYRIDSIYGNCPVQAEGDIDGKRFYFRARGERWSFGVGDNDDEAIDGKLFEHVEPYAVGEKFAAGWMEESEARTLIERAVKLYEERPR